MTDTAPKANGIMGAAQGFEALLASGSADLNAPEYADAPESAPADEAEVVEGPVDGDEAAPVSAEADTEVAPEDEAVHESEEPEEAVPEVQLVTIKVNGKTEQIPLEEAVKGYQRQADYSQKTAALAEERKALNGEMQQVTQERAQYAQLLTALTQQLQQLQPQEPDWQKLYDADPIEYVRQKDAWRERQEKMVAAQYEMSRVQTLQAQQQQAQLATLVQTARQQMLETMPQWRDNQKWEADRSKLLDYGQKSGWTADELNQTYDPRAVVTLYKAMQYDALMANKPQPNTPKGPKTAAPGNATTAPKPANEVTRAKQRLAKTGKVADAASLMESFI